MSSTPDPSRTLAAHAERLLVAHFDPDNVAHAAGFVYEQMQPHCTGVEGTVRLTFEDGSTLRLWGNADIILAAETSPRP